MKVHKGKRVFALLIAMSMLAPQVTSAYAIDVVNIEETAVSEETGAPEVTEPIESTESTESAESQPPDSSDETQETTVESEETSGVDETPPPVESGESSEVEETQETTTAPPIESEETTTVESEETTIGSSTVNIRPRPNRPQSSSDRVSGSGEVTPQAVQLILTYL